MMNTILITGAKGQIGRELIPALAQAYPTFHLLGVGRSPFIEDSAHQDVKYFPESEHTSDRFSLAPNFSYEMLDVRDQVSLKQLTQTYKITHIYHLAGLLSAKGEKYSSLCWDINVNGLKNILELATQTNIKVFWPSSIAVFGPGTPKVLTPQGAITTPSTMYGITKVTGELLCQYYAQHYQVDIRSLRLPGLISYQVLPGGGTTDYAVEMFYGAVESGQYDCFVTPQTCLPMMYMPDCIRAILLLMQSTLSKSTRYISYNLTSFSPTAAELVSAIQTVLPKFICRYQPDYRQAIADSWPISIDDSQARHDWGWQPTYNLSTTVKDMITHLSWRYAHDSQNQAPIPIYS